MAKPIRFLDIEIRSDHLREDAMKLLNEIRPGWTEDGMETENFSEGFMNAMICFHQPCDTDKKDAIVVRVFGDVRASLPHISSDNEVKAMQLAHLAGCCQPLEAIFCNGMAYKFAVGRTLKSKDLLDPHIVRQVTMKLAALHSVEVDSVSAIDTHGDSGVIVNKISMEGKLDWMLQKIPERLKDPKEDERYQKNRIPTEKLQQALMESVKMLKSLDLDTGLIHGDFHIKNIIYNHSTGEISFVDFEGSQKGFRAHDMSMVFTIRPIQEILGIVQHDEPRITEDIRALWLRCYLEANYELQGKDPKQIPEMMFQLLDMQHRIYEVHQTLFYTTAMHTISQFPHLRGVDGISAIPKNFEEYQKKKERLNEYINNYCRLKLECKNIH